MKDLILEATPTTPHICFEVETGKLLMEGESYPENASRFFESVFVWIEEYLSQVGRSLEVHFRLNYFNTSSSKCILDLLEKLEAYAVEGGKIRVIWHYHEDDEDILQYKVSSGNVVGVPVPPGAIPIVRRTAAVVAAIKATPCGSTPGN